MKAKETPNDESGKVHSAFSYTHKHTQTLTHMQRSTQYTRFCSCVFSTEIRLNLMQTPSKLSLKAAHINKHTDTTHRHTHTGTQRLIWDRLSHEQRRHLPGHIYDVNDKTKWTSGRDERAREQAKGHMKAWRGRCGVARWVTSVQRFLHFNRLTQTLLKPHAKREKYYSQVSECASVLCVCACVCKCVCMRTAFAMQISAKV